MSTPPPQGGLGQSWFVLNFEAEYAGEETPVEPGLGGSSEAGFFGPVGQRVRFRGPVTLSLLRQVELRAPVRQNAVREVSLSLPVQLSGAKRFEQHIPVVREAATLYAAAIREDDELLTILAAI